VLDGGGALCVVVAGSLVDEVVVVLELDVVDVELGSVVSLGAVLDDGLAVLVA
jgi:hypothetical protein